MCWKCGKPNKVESIISRSDACEYCGADLRCCKNCAFYEPGAHYDCHETIDELVSDKEKANFCGFFKFSEKSSSINQTLSSKKSSDAKKAFNALFGE